MILSSSFQTAGKHSFRPDTPCIQQLLCRMWFLPIAAQTVQDCTMLTTTWRKTALTPASLARGLPIWFNSVSISSILLLIIAKIPGMRALITASSCCSQKTIALMLHWGCKMLYNCITRRREPWQRLSFHPKSIRGNCDQIFKSIIQMKTSPKSDRSSNGIRLKPHD